MDDLHILFPVQGYVAEGSFCPVEKFNQQQNEWAARAIERLIAFYKVDPDDVTLDYDTWRDYKVAVVYVGGYRYHFNPLSGKVIYGPA